ncbi:hypothetical protein C8R45DRAFT_67713 [Mycena sanguinolenta]|nr:hypothetical protein C8R45DRAFT_67713 [Mycena sanguinolenta]
MCWVGTYYLAIRAAEAEELMAEATAGPSVQRAPPVPDSIHEKAQKKKTQLEQKIRAILQNPLENALELLASEVDQWQKNLEDFESPLTVRSRERTLAEWEAHLLLTKPHLDVNMHWHKKTVLENAPGFLYTKVKVATATAEKTMKARTLSGWMGLLLNSITTYTRDDAGIKCGLHVLVRGGLYKTLKQSVITLIHQFKLDRYHNSKLYYGRYELERIINKILHSSRSQGREVALQHIVSFLCTFFFTSRASSLGPTHVKWRELDYFITLGDLTIYCNGFCDWDIDIRFGQFKTAIGTMQGLEQIFRACGVKLSHNVLFDITVALMAHLWAMGAFKKKYTRPEDLLEDTSRYQMELDPDMLHLPLFRAATPHGRRFIEPVRAAMSRSFGDAMSYWAGEAGLPRAGCTALRRDAGNLYGLQLGTKLAKDILNHHVTGVFRKSYSQNMQNLRLVGIRLGEDAGQKEAVAGDKLKEHNDRHVLASFAVEALVRDTRRDQEAEAAEADKTKREYKKSLDDGALKTEHESRTEAWEEYLKCFSVSAAGYQMGTANANKILERAVTGKEVKKEVLEFVKREDAPELYNKATAQPKLDAFLKAEKEYLKERTKLIREYTKNLKNAVNYDLLHTIKTGSPQERRAAADSLLTAHPSPHMAQAVEDALHQVRPAQNAHNIDDVRAWVKNLTQAAETTALNDYLEAQEAEGEENQLVQFLEKLDLNVPQDDIFSPPPPPPATTLTSLDVQLEDGAPDIDESQETDILKIPVTDMRRHMFMYYCHPIVIAREYAALQVLHDALLCSCN